MVSLLLFLINIITLVFLLRFAFQSAQLTPTDHPFIGQTYQFTGVVDVLDKIIPPIKGKVSVGALLVVFLLNVLMFYVTALVKNDFNHAPFNMFMYVLCSTLIDIFNLYYYLTLIMIILSWVIMFTQRSNPMYDLTSATIRPILEPVDRVMPAIGPFSISVVVIMMSLYALTEILEHIRHIWYVGG